MAKTDLETLVVRMEAQMKAFENELKKGRQAADRETRAIEKRFADTNKKLAGSFSGLGSAMKSGLGALGIGLGAREIQRFADQYTSAQNALRVAGLEGEALTKTYDRLFASAQRNAAPIEALVTLYGRAAMVQKELRVSSDDLIRFSDRIALALRVSGKSAQESSGALLQLSQALGSGTVRAQEFNSMVEGALPVVQAAANGIEEAGGSVAKLRQLVNDGKVSSEAFFRGFMAGSVMLEKQAAGMQMTIGQATTLVFNAFTDAVGKLNEMTGAGADAVKVLRELAGTIGVVAENIGRTKGGYDELAKALHGVASEAEGAWKWLDRVARLNVPANVGKYVAGRVAEWWNGPKEPTDAGAQPLAGAPGAQPPLPPVKPISLKNFPASGQAGSSTVGVDSFARALAAAQKRIAVQNAETAAINEGTAARERAKLVAELETAAKAANAAAGLKNTEVTTAQRGEIDKLADAMYRSAQAAEAANEPMARAARAARDMNTNLQELAVHSLDDLAQSIADVAAGTTTAAEAFRSMAASILRDLGQMIIKAALWNAVSGFMGGPSGSYMMGGVQVPVFGGKRASGGPVSPGKSYLVGENGPEIFAPRIPGTIIPNSKSGGMSFSFAPVIDARGADEAAVARLMRELSAMKAEFEPRVKSIVANRPNARW